MPFWQSAVAVLLTFFLALVASRVLGLALTTRDKGKENPIPMCGVPVHAAESYLNRLIKRGFRVAVDFNNGGCGRVASRFLDRLRCTLLPVNAEPTGDLKFSRLADRHWG